MGSFVLLGEFVVPPKTHLAQGACNPEKDLVLLIHNSESRDTLSLWKLQGSKRWEIDVVGNFDGNGSLRHISWSPDGDKFALGHAAKRVTVHDVLDGCEEFRYNDAPPGDGLKAGWKMASLTWLKMPWNLFWNEDISSQPPPQLYPREYDAPGSTFYVFKHLPRLDYKVPLIERMNEEAIIADGEWLRRPTAEPLAVHRAPRYMFPPSAHGWPSLPFNLAGASISPSYLDTNETLQMNDPKDRWYVTQSNTCLFAGDNHGGLYPFIHGTYLAGTIETRPTFSHLVSAVTGTSCLYFSRLCIQSQAPSLVLSEISGRVYSTQETSEFASSSDYKLRDILRISTAAKDLALYASRNCGEAEIAWVGGGGQEGAREWNQKWCRLLDSLQTRQNDGNSRPKGVKTDLTFFLLTGVPLSATLSENLEHGSQTTERNFKKWHGVVHETLLHIKHLAEISLLSLQRLIAILWDLLGMAEIKPIARDFMLDRVTINECIEIASAAVEVLSLMADVTRKEIQGFSHFMIWLRGLIPNLPAAELPLDPYDILIVNNYIANGLYPSGIDGFFELRTEPPPEEEKKMPPAPQTFQEIALGARQAMKDLRDRKPVEVAPRKHFPEEKRIRPMITSLMIKCNKMFERIASSISTATEQVQDVTDVPRDQHAGLLVRKETHWKQIILPQGIKQSAFREGYLQAPRLNEVVFREKLVAADAGVVQYVLVRLPGQDNSGEEGRGQRLCIVRLVHTRHPPKTQGTSCAMFNLAFPEELDSESEKMENEDNMAVNLLDVQFYDDKQLVLVLQTVGIVGTERRAIVLFNFVDPEYHLVPDLGPSLDMEVEILQRFADGVLPSQALELTSFRLISMKAGSSTVSLAVNSKRGVAVLLDHDRGVVQSYDLANEEEEEDTNQDDHESTEREESMETS